jgi:hypothetical protein
MKGKTMVRNQKTKAVHRALSRYMRPKLRRGADIDFTPSFVGVDDSNIAQNLSHIAAAAMASAHDVMAFDANPHELNRKMREALHEDGTMKHDENDDVVAKVLALLEGRLTPSELRAVHDILTRKTPSRKAAAPSRGLEDVAEDAAARVAFDARFPSAARVPIEPVARPERQPQPSPGNYEGFFTRFPNARRVGL